MFYAILTIFSSQFHKIHDTVKDLKKEHVSKLALYIVHVYFLGFFLYSCGLGPRGFRTRAGNHSPGKRRLFFINLVPYENIYSKVVK